MQEDNKDGVPVALIARVSSNKQARGYNKEEESDLTRQEDKLEAWIKANIEGAQITKYSRIGSGLFYEHPTFLKLVDDLLAGKYRYAVCTHRDRACRYGFSMLERIAARGGCKLIVLSDVDEEEKEKEKTFAETIAEDVISLLTHTAARYHGKRAAETTSKNVSPQCVERMIELRKANHPITGIVRQLNEEGYTMKRKNGNEEPVSDNIVLRYSNSNGIESALVAVSSVGSKQHPTPLDDFLAARIEMTGNRKDKILNMQFHEEYSEYCAKRGLQPEAIATLGLLLNKRGIQKRRSMGRKWLAGCRWR
jgi:predicted site-specific integrase-resolvase